MLMNHSHLLALPRIIIRSKRVQVLSLLAANPPFISSTSSWQTWGAPLQPLMRRLHMMLKELLLPVLPRPVPVPVQVTAGVHQGNRH